MTSAVRMRLATPASRRIPRERRSRARDRAGHHHLPRTQARGHSTTRLRECCAQFLSRSLPRFPLCLPLSSPRCLPLASPACLASFRRQVQRQLKLVFFMVFKKLYDRLTTEPGQRNPVLVRECRQRPVFPVFKINGHTMFCGHLGSPIRPEALCCRLQHYASHHALDLLLGQDISVNTCALTGALVQISRTLASA